MSKILRCTILSVQDTNILYPSCPRCFSRVTLTSGSDEQSSRWSCVKCGRDDCSAAYRYRLALRVSRDCEVVGVTVFGSSLDYFFGVPAGQLHRYLTACNESRGAPMTEWLMQRALEDCFVGRAVLLAVKQLPGNMAGEHGHVSPVRLQWPAEWPGPVTVRRTPEHYTASKMTVAQEGVFGATVLQYLQSLQRACASSDGLQCMCTSSDNFHRVCACSDGLQRVCASSNNEGPQDASLGSDQASYHDYTRLCPGGSCLHWSETDGSSFPLPLQQSPGFSSEFADSPECSLSRARDKMRRTSDSAVSVAVVTWSCCDGHHGSASQESGYSEASRDKEDLSGSFSPTSLTPAESLACSFSQSVFLDELLAHAFPTPFTHHNLSVESLSGPYISESFNQRDLPTGSLSGPYASESINQHDLPTESLSGPYISESFNQHDLPTESLSGPYASESFNQHDLPTESLSGSYASESFAQYDLSTESLSGSSCSRSSGVDTSQNQERSHRADSSEPAGSSSSSSTPEAPVSSSTPEALASDSEEGSYNCSAELFDDVSGLDRKDMHRSEQVGRRPRKSARFSSLEQGTLRTPVCNLSIKPGRPLSPVCLLSMKQGRTRTPACHLSVKTGRPQTPVCLQPVSQSTPILCRATPANQRVSRPPDLCKEAAHTRLDPNCEPGLWETGSGADGQIKCSSRDGGQIEGTTREGRCCSRDCGHILSTSGDDGQIECNRGVDGQIEYASGDDGQIECSAAGEEGQIKCTAGDGSCCDDMLSGRLLMEEANWSRDLFVDSDNESE